MFKNRELAIRMRKANETDPAEKAVKDEVRVEQIKTAAQKLIITTALAVYGFVALDTYRQVKIAQNTNIQS